MRLLVEAIDDGVAGEDRDRYLGEIRTHVAVLSDLIDDLFELSRIEAGDISWTMRQVELGDLIGDTVAAFRTSAEERGVHLAAELPAGKVVAEADAEKVQRVLFNLIQNAIRHTPADGSVTVRAKGGPGGVEVEVADSGEGIPAAEGERVFEAFYRGERSRNEDGAGLGLAISRAIVEAHGGRIWLEDAHPGTRVRFTPARPSAVSSLRHALGPKFRTRARAAGSSPGGTPPGRSGRSRGRGRTGRSRRTGRSG